MTDELCHLSIAEMSRRIQARTLSPVELTEACLARIEALNPAVHAFLEGSISPCGLPRSRCPTSR